MARWDDPELVVLDNLASLVGFRTGDPDRWHELQHFLMLQRRYGPRHPDGPSRQQAGPAARHQPARGHARPGDGARRRADYQPQDGARFEIHFEKARGLYGDAVDPIEARLETDQAGVARWSWRPVQLGQLERVAALLRQGLKPNRVAQELGIAQSYCYRLSERARASGLV